MKKLLPVLLILLMLMTSFAACSGGADQKKTETTTAGSTSTEKPDVQKQDEPVTLSVSHCWYAGDAHAPFMEWSLKDFQQKYPYITLDINEIPQENIRQKIRADFMGDVATDIVLWYGGAEAYEYVRQDMLLDISDFLGPIGDRFFDGALDNMSFDGKNYGLPLAQNFFALYLNKDIYTKYNLEFPKTYEELLEQVTKFKAVGLIPIMLPGKNHGLIQHFYSFISNMTTKNGEFEKASYKEDGKTFKDPGFVKAAEIVAELHEKGAFDPNVDGIPMASVEDMFNQGKGAMYFAGIWRVGALSEESRARMHPILFPEVKGFTESTTVATGQTEMGWVVNAAIKGDSAKMAALGKFIDYFASAETSQKHVELTDTVIPVQKGVDISTASYAVKQSVELANASQFRPFLRYYQSPAQGTATNEMTWHLINGRNTVDGNLKILLDIPANAR